MKYLYVLLLVFSSLIGFSQSNYHWHHLNQGNSLGSPVSGFLNGMLPDSSTGKLIVFGSFSNNTSIQNMAIWDGNQQWVQYGDYNQFDALSTEIRTAIYFHDTLFFSEFFGGTTCPSPRSNPGLMYYSGTQICHINGGFTSNGGLTWIYSLINFNDTLYVGGNFDIANVTTSNQDSTNNIAKLSGDRFVPIGMGSTNGCTHPGNIGEILKLYSNDSLIFVGGYFEYTGGLPQNNITITDGNNWLPIPDFPYYIYDIIFWNNELFILGDALYKLVGTTWIQIAQFSNGANPGFATCMEIFNGELVIGGSFTSINGFPANCIAKFDGVTWDNMDSGTSSFSPEVKDLLSWNGSLYACGRFDQMGTVQANKIARWGLTTSIVEVDELVDLKVLTNPCREQIKISLGHTTKPIPFELLDVSGRFILNGNFKSGNNEIDIDGLSAGVYIIHQQQNKFIPLRVLVY